MNYLKLISFILLGCILLLSSCKNNKKSEEMFLKDITIVDFNSITESSEYVEHYYAGMYLAIDEINKANGIHGLPIRLVVANDYNNQVDSYIVAEKMFQKHNPLLISGTYLDQPAIGIAKFANDNKIPFIATGSSLSNLTDGMFASEYVFRLKPSDKLNIISLTSKIIKNKNIKNLHILTYSNYRGDELSQLIKSQILKNRSDIKFLPDIRLNKNMINDKSINDFIYALHGRNIIIAIDGIDIKPLLNNLLNSKSVIAKSLYILNAGEPEWFEALEKNNPQNSYVTGFPWYVIDTEDNNIFIQKYHNKYNFNPRYASYLGYINVYFIAQAIREANVKNSTPQDRQKIAKSLSKQRVKTPLGEVYFRKDNQSNLSSYAGYFTESTTYKTKGTKKYKIIDIKMNDIKIFSPIEYLQSESSNIKQTKEIKQKIYQPKTIEEIVKR